jgi:biotin carboxyl carrier protein
MKSTAKYAGKKEAWVTAEAAAQKEWSFERRPGGWVIGTRTVNGAVTERTRFYYAKNKQQFFAKLTRADSLDFYGERIPETRAGAQGSSASDYLAQFPGKVRKILLKDGTTVTTGTPILMVEAMKMEFAIKATSDGMVKKILVEEGMILTPGQKLLDFEETKKAKP